MSGKTLCVPCALALRPPASEPPHGCPGQIQVVSGAGTLRVVLCECPACWPDRSAGDPGEPAES